MDEKTGMEGGTKMTQMTLGEALLLIVGGGLILGLSYWLGLKNGEVTRLSFSIELPQQQPTVATAKIKHQDILMTDDGPIIVMRPSSVVPYKGEMITVAELYAHGKIEGVYPVESFISFGEGESNA